MVTQVEHIEDHLARLTTDIPRDVLDAAMQDAASKVSAKYAIPGFRKGKAPYNQVVKYLGMQVVLEQAVDDLMQDVYQLAIEEANLTPYAPGVMIDFKLDPEVQFIFTVPKQPDVEIGNYREVRLPFSVEDVTEKQVDDAISSLRTNRATVAVVDRGAELGDMVKFHVTGDIVRAPVTASVTPALLTEPAADATAASGDRTDGTDTESDVESSESTSAVTPATPIAISETATEGGSVESFIDQELDDVLTDDLAEDLVPGFSAALVGTKAGEQREFSITLPEDFADEGYANQVVEFIVDVEEVKARTLPELDDEFAKVVTNGQEDTMDAFRARVRKDLQDGALRNNENKFADLVIEEIRKDATISYPTIMVENAIDDLVRSLERNLEQNGLTMDQYKSIERKTDDEIREGYRDTAKLRVEKSLILTEIVSREQISVPEERIAERIAEMSRQFGENAEMFREVLNSAQNQQNIALDLLTETALHRVVEIGRGDNPPLPEGNIVPRAESQA